MKDDLGIEEVTDEEFMEVDVKLIEGLMKLELLVEGPVKAELLVEGSE